MKLTSKQRKYLRSKAHHLKPLVIIGKTELDVTNEILKLLNEKIKRVDLK